MENQLRSLGKALSEQIPARPPVQQRMAAQLLATEASRSHQREAIDALDKLIENLTEDWKDLCGVAVSGSERISSALQKTESSFRSTLLELESAKTAIREEDERVSAILTEHDAKNQRVTERCQAILRDISPDAKQD